MATCQIILDVVRHGFVNITDFNLIIFDECHHGRNEHPMHQFMSYFENYPEKDLPRVIGLTGSVTSASVKPQNVVLDLLQLEATFRSTIATVKGMGKFQDVLLHSTCPKESFVRFEAYKLPPIIISIIDKVCVMIASLDSWPIDMTHQKTVKIDMNTNRMPNPLKKIGKLLNDFVYQIKDLGK